MDQEPLGLRCLVFSLNLFELGKVLAAMTAFESFCLAACAVYLFNDLLGRERDRFHPQKQYRPISSGRLSLQLTSVAALALVTASLTLVIIRDRRLLVTVLL